MTSSPVVAKTAQIKSPQQPLRPEHDPLDPKLYFGAGGVAYPPCLKYGVGFLTLPVLPFVWGRKLDEVVMGYVHSLRPSIIRIVTEGMHADCRKWRVTICVKKVKRSYFVQRIWQEVEVGLPKGVAHGDALCLALQFGADSDRVKWHRDALGYALAGKRYTKDTKKGSVEWQFDPKAKRRESLWHKFNE